MESLETLRNLESHLKDEFIANRRVMSFDEYFHCFCESPVLQTRTSAQYLRDCLDYYGRRTIETPYGDVTRFNVFDLPWEEEHASASTFRVVGQESAQDAIYRMLTNFTREGRITRLILLHGPNGSAKSSLIQCLARGLEAYSQTDEGAIYRFNWVFPSNRISKKRLGFSDNDDPTSVESHAHLDEENIDALLPGDLRDHPILLLPLDKRSKILDDLLEKEAFPKDFCLGDYVRNGDLSPRSKDIFDALLNAYHGDFQEVLRHIQVERFFFSRRYRRGIVTIEPQMHVDAGLRQLTRDQQLLCLPPSLRSLNLFEPFGDLVDANRGLVEFNDLLKKPLDTYKYLLATCEKGTVALTEAILHLDMLFVASSNERHLNAFKEYQDFPSFKGRMDLIKMPYLRNYRVEQAIYDEQIANGKSGLIVAPHSTYVVAIWAVLSRLRKPDVPAAPESLKEVLRKLTPMEKAQLYAGEREPDSLSPEQSRELRAWVPQLLSEAQEEEDYEGSFGASPREMKEVMLNAMQKIGGTLLTPLAIFDELRELVKLKSIYEFLQRKKDGGYHDHEAFIEQVYEGWLDRVDNEVRASMGLVAQKEYDELFGRYILHISYLLKKERVYSEATGKSEEPDVHLMNELERVWKAGDDRDSFRRDLVGRVGAWRIGHPGDDIDYRNLFPKLFALLERDYYEKQKTTIQKLSQFVLTILAEEAEVQDPKAKKVEVSPQDRITTLETINNLETTYGYPRPFVREALGALMGARY